jgi:RNA polymerase sigma factor (sigma-70 family)
MTPRHLLAPARLAGSRLLATQSDERLVDLLRAGSEPAFEAIVSRYRGQLLRYCSALLGRERAEDAVQQTFVKAYDAMHRDDRSLLLKPWLYRIAHNTARNALRDNALRDEPLGEEDGVDERPELVLERRERLRAVLASVQDLPPRQRDALVLRELEGRSYEEIAAALGVGGGAVRQLLNRARTTLRTAATAITPVGLLLRLPTAGSVAGESVAARVAEITGAAGAGAVASKVAATALVTGAVAGGAAVAPLGESDGTPRGRAAEAREERGGAGAPPRVAATPVPGSMGPASSVLPAEVVPRGRGDRSGPGSGRAEGHDRSGRGGNSGPGNSSGPGGGSGSGDNSGHGTGPGSGSGRSGSGDGTTGSNSGPGSGSSGPGPSGHGTSGSGSGGGSGSGSSGSGSGSGSSGSGSGSSGNGSGSGSSGGGSGSTGSGSGSAGDGSGTSGSGSGSSAPVSPPPEPASGSSGSGSGQ